MQPLMSPNVTGIHVAPLGHEPPQLGNVPPQGYAGHTHTISPGESGNATQVWPPGHALPLHDGYWLSTQSVLPEGTHPHVPSPPGTHASPGGHVPSHSNAPTGPHGALPATHWQSAPMRAQIGVAAGHSPRHVPPTWAPQPAPGGGQ